MRSKLLIGALCVAAMLFVAPEADAQVVTGKIAKEVSKVWQFTTDTSTIFQIMTIAHNSGTDLDILVTITDEDDDGEEFERVVADSLSSTAHLEQAFVGLEGDRAVTVTVTHFSGPLTRFVLMITQPAFDAQSARLGNGVRYLGEFGPNDVVDDPRLAQIQTLLDQRGTTKR